MIALGLLALAWLIGIAWYFRRAILLGIATIIVLQVIKRKDRK